MLWRRLEPFSQSVKVKSDAGGGGGLVSVVR